VDAPKLDEITIVYTPLHGVGSMQALEILTRQGFRVVTVEEQMASDGQFPNVTKSPNPEVPESLDRAEKLAREVKADLVLATDPDADRLGGLTATSTPGRYALLDGNSIAAMLTHFKLAKLTEQDAMPKSPIVVKTLVTTGMISRIARHYNCQLVDNLLVGFKFIAEVLWQLDQNGTYEDVFGTPSDFVIASEESHGVLVTPEIRDKDAGASALLLAELALDEKRNGRTLEDYLHALQKQFGYFKNDLANIVMPGIEGKQLMGKMLSTLRKTPPQEIGGLQVTEFIDLQSPDCWMGPIKGNTDLAGRNFLVFKLGQNARIALRPSGTEPKAKAYVEVCSDPCKPGTTDAQWQRVRHEVDAVAKRVADDFLAMALGTVGKKP
jgi:phosphoglucomutase/phosphomannomutase